MYVPGQGLVPTINASIVEPPQFVGMRRKHHISDDPPVPVTAPKSVSAPKSEDPPYNRRNPPKSIHISPKAKHDPHVLIVEDNSVNALILETFLRKRGYPFAKAENGLLAVQAVQARPEGFNVILMDIQSTPHIFFTNSSARDGWMGCYRGYSKY